MNRLPLCFDCNTQHDKIVTCPPWKWPGWPFPAILGSR